MWKGGPIFGVNQVYAIYEKRAHILDRLRSYSGWSASTLDCIYHKIVCHFGTNALVSNDVKFSYLIKQLHAQCTKKTLMQFANNAGPDQPAHLRRLVWAFVVRLQNQWILQYMWTNRECPDQTALVRTLALRCSHYGIRSFFPRCASKV